MPEPDFNIVGTDFKDYGVAIQTKLKDDTYSRKILNNLGREMTVILKGETPVNRGKLRRSTKHELLEPIKSIDPETQEEIITWVLIIKQTHRAYRYGTFRSISNVHLGAGKLGVQAHGYYGDILQVGTKAHIPPIIQILAWASDKFGYEMAKFTGYLEYRAAIKQAGGRSVPNPVTLSGLELEDLDHVKAIVFGVIGRKGIKKNPYDQVALKMSEPAIDAAVDALQGVGIATLAHEEKGHISYVTQAT